MSDSLSKQIAQFMQAQPRRHAGKARAVVIAQREEIAKAMADGWSVMAIWKTLRHRGSVQVGYHAFRRYVAEVVPASSSRADVARRRASCSPHDNHPRDAAARHAQTRVRARSTSSARQDLLTNPLGASDPLEAEAAGTALGSEYPSDKVDRVRPTGE